MISTGNDIVSLNAIDVARTKQHRFYSKIISASEKLLYDSPEFGIIPFENFVWLLWSIKESAYKFLQRTRYDLVFNPIKFEIDQLNIPAGFKTVGFNAEGINGCGFVNGPVLKGTISTGANQFYSRSLIYKEAIMTVLGCCENFNNTYWGIKKIATSDYDIQSAAVRTLLIEQLQKVLPFNELTISKSEWGIPVLLSSENDTRIPVSLSHHDHFIAYSFQLPD